MGYLCCHLAWIWNSQGVTPPGISARVFAEGFSWGGKTYTEYGWHHPMDWWRGPDWVKRGEDGGIQLSPSIHFFLLPSLSIWKHPKLMPSWTLPWCVSIRPVSLNKSSLPSAPMARLFWHSDEKNDTQASGLLEKARSTRWQAIRHHALISDKHMATLTGDGEIVCQFYIWRDWGSGMWGMFSRRQSFIDWVGHLGYTRAMLPLIGTGSLQSKSLYSGLQRTPAQRRPVFQI